MSTTKPYLLPGSIFQHNGQDYCLRRFIDESEVEAIHIGTGELLKVAAGDITKTSCQDNQVSRMDLVSLDEERWAQALERYRVLEPLLAMSERTRQDVEAVAAAAKINPATLYRWIARFEETGNLSSLVRRSRSDVGKSRLLNESENIQQNVIRTVFLQKQAVSPKRAYRDVEKLCRNEKIQAPHFSTFRRRLLLLSPSELAVTREGRKAARRFNLIKGSFPGADYPYAVIQIDHTPLDIILVDETHRLPLRRPNITLAIDVFSRMVVGYYISFDPPGTVGTAMCIANTVLPKDQFLSSAGLKFDWPCQGLPAVIHLDNAKEFRGNTLKMACDEYQINLQFRPVRTPNYGGHIERLLGTLLREIHALPGTTRSSSEKLGEYKPSEKAAMTLKEFESWFANLVLGAYHHRIHSELGMPPITKFMQGVMGDASSPGTGLPPPPRDEEQFRIDFLPYELRTVQPYGIALDGIYYQADVLGRWVGSKDPKDITKKRKFIVRRDPRDISCVLFFDPEVKRYFRIPYQNPRFPAISLWELRQVQRHLKSQGKKAENQDVIFAAFEEMQQIEENALKTTKGARISAAKRANRKPEPPAVQPKQSQANTTQTDDGFNLDDLKPFDDIEEIA